MTPSDRIYHILADDTPVQQIWTSVVGKPSSSLIQSTEPSDEYCEGIILQEPIIITTTQSYEPVEIYV
jgi:hypothetical protein